MALDYFYDAQIRRYLIQVARIFGNFKYKEIDSTGKTIYKKVPFVYAATNSQVQTIINNNSENTLTTLPIFSIYLSSLKQNHSRRQDPTYVNRQNVTERGIDKTTNSYNDQSGNKYTVEMLMPVAYDMTVKIDLITTNESQKWQLLEQILVLFNPEVELQTSTNAVDWTALSIISLTDINVTPAANNSTINDMTTLTFNVPIWINPPAKVKRSSLIQEIILNIGNLTDYNTDVDEYGESFAKGEIMHTSVVTPDQAYISVSRCYKNNNVYYIDLVSDTNGTPLEDNWTNIFSKYGNFIEGSSILYLLQNIKSLDENSSVYAGRIYKDITNDKRLIFNIDPNTLQQTNYPNNTITNIIDPTVVYPSNTNINVNDTFLLLQNINQNTKEWGTIYYNDSPNLFDDYAAMENDIIKWDGTRWNIVFKANENESEKVYYKNINNGDYLVWDMNIWRMSIEAIYAPGYWRLDL